MFIATRLIPPVIASGPGDDDASGGSSQQNGGAHASTIVLVEDEYLIRLTIADHLRDCGYRVLEAGNAAEAQQVFQSGEPIELMISDVSMPGMDSIALAEWVRAAFPDVLIVLMSGQKVNRGRLAGITFIDKPSALENVERLIRKLLKQ